MSLLTRKAPHTAYIQRRRSERNERGLNVWVNVGDLIRERCMVEPVRDWSQAEEAETVGLQVIDLMVVRSKTWRGDINSHVLWNGNWYETVGAPQHHSASKRTSHWRVTIKWLRKDG